MKKNVIKYSIVGSENKLNGIIRDEIKRKTIDKKYNLSGEYSNFGGFDLYKHIAFGYSEPSTSPLIILNLKSVNIDKDGLKSEVTLKRVNAESYDLHSAIAIIFATIMAIVSSYQIFKHGFMKNIVLSIMPIFGFGYFLVVEFIAVVSFKSLCKRIEKIMNAEEIIYRKQ